MVVSIFLVRFDVIQDTYQGLHGAVESMSVVPSELGVNTLERGVTVRLWLLDTVHPKPLAIVLSLVLHAIIVVPASTEARNPWSFQSRRFISVCGEFGHTRCGGLSCSGSPGTSSWTL